MCSYAEVERQQGPVHKDCTKLSQLISYAVATEIELKLWRYGQTQAERLCADLLTLQDFSDVDPQAPLGGGDGKKDILCSKSGIRYVAAAYFPITDKSFAEVRRKFLDDLKGVAANGCDGFIFFTNQHLTIGEREALLQAAESSTRDCQIFHFERIRTLLDQPAGYGIRLQYLRIPLTPEEQFAYFANSRDGVDRSLERHGRLLSVMNDKLDKIVERQQFVVQTMALTAERDGLTISPPPTRPDLFLGGLYRADPSAQPGWDQISVSGLLALHRAICFDMPSNDVGHLRRQAVYLAAPGKPSSKAVAVPPDAKDISRLLTALCEDWQANFPTLKSASDEVRLRAIASFHANFLRIHPFLDGNGRVARFILMQQTLDFFGVADMGVLDKGADYYAALLNADNDDLTFLVRLLRPVAGLEVGQATMSMRRND
jgi:fido (protein-threonine AMPylation protein)